MGCGSSKPADTVLIDVPEAQRDAEPIDEALQDNVAAKLEKWLTQSDATPEFEDELAISFPVASRGRLVELKRAAWERKRSKPVEQPVKADDVQVDVSPAKRRSSDDVKKKKDTFSKRRLSGIKIDTDVLCKLSVTRSHGALAHSPRIRQAY